MTVDRTKDDLYLLSGEREIYRDLRVTEIDMGNSVVSLSNVQMLAEGETRGGLNGLKDTGGETQADDDTYKLIMKDKEKLLDESTPLRFIFSHSALREGWDNPNVFQICTLNETKSEIKKRQEIGRGLRLCVNSEGQRIHDRNTNKLTVIANEHYEDFATALQKEIEEECGVAFTGRIKNKADRQKVNYRKGFEADPKFLQLWEKIRGRTRYSVDYSSEELIALAGKGIANDMPTITSPSIRSTRQRVIISDEGVSGEMASDTLIRYKDEISIPDLLNYIQGKTELTRDTILQILKRSGRISEVFVNPQMFMDLVVRSIRLTLYDLMIDGIKYEKIGSKVYEMTLFDDSDFEIYLNSFTHTVKDSSKTIYDNYIPLDSGVENQFARDCENSENVEFYFKLPNWFKIPTPIGNYNPDWAVVFKGKKKIYFVAETKSEEQELLKSEHQKIKCGKKHFREFADILYKQVSSLRDLS